MASVEKLFDTEAITTFRRRAMKNDVPGSDFLLALVADELTDRLCAVERSFAHAAELHGHTGLVAERLMHTGKIEKLTRIETHADLLAGTAGLVGTHDSPGLATEAYDLVVSPLSLHLTSDTPGVLVQTIRALKPDGLFLAALPAAGTLGELRACLLAAESELTGGASQRVMPFADVRDCGALLQRAGFALPVADVDTHVVRYSDMFALIRDLRAMGMQNPLASRSRRPLGRSIFLRAAEIYAERFADPDGRIRATFVVVYLSGWRPHPSQQQPLRPGTAKTSLADALNAKRR